jgi:MFS family permease
MAPAYFYGWNVVAATFIMALLSFGLGFYGLTVYIAALQQLHGWTASAVSLPVTVYYVGGAMATVWIGEAYERFGPRVIVTAGSIAMAVGVASLGIVTAPWQLYPVFLVMSAGWGSMSGAAINIILAPWFERRRGLVVSIAFNGATLGGVVIAPLLIPLIERLGFDRAVVVAAAVLFIVVAVAARWMASGPDAVSLGPDGDQPRSIAPQPPPGRESHHRRDALRRWRFWSVSMPFALGLMAQVGVLTHLVPLIAPVLGAPGAARALTATTAAAVVGRLITATVVDRLNRRVVTSANLLVQALGLTLLASGRSAGAVYAGCALFGFGVGNLTTLPGLVLAVEWPRERFSALVGLVVGINQFTFAFGPALVGLLRDLTGSYDIALGACVLLQAIAATLVMLGPGRRR